LSSQQGISLCILCLGSEKVYNLARHTSEIEDAIFEINKLDLLQNLKYSDVLKLLDTNIANYQFTWIIVTTIYRYHIIANES